MSIDAEAAAARTIRGPRSLWMLLALALGLMGGTLAASAGDGLREPLIQSATVVGTLWLNALRMTVIPLIVALLVTGIARTSEAARGGRIATVSVVVFGIIYFFSASLGALLTPLLTSLFPLSENAADAMRVGLSAVDVSAVEAAVPKASDFVQNIVPPNAIGAAANGDVLPLVVFTLLFAIAVTQLPEQPRRTLVALFESISDTLLIVISWVLWVAPVGIIGLAFALAASAGGGAFAGLAYYIVLVSVVGLLVTLGGYLIAMMAGGMRIGQFARAMIGPQTVAVSTRSSLASLPAMVAAARNLGIRDEIADVTLPLAVALLRATGPAMNLAVLFYVAEWMGIEPSMPQVIAAIVVAMLMSLSSVSLPGEISFVSSLAPIGLTLGIPLAPLALLIAVEMVPDIFRTLGNVTLDVAATSVVDRQTAPQS